MKILAVDSSSKVATCAILTDNALLGEYVLNDKKEHSILLMPMIEKLLQDCNLTTSDLDGFVVSKGPGSFTGLRIGMATIKGLSFGCNMPYVSISSLEALAYGVSSFDGIICPIMDALRENVYTALYKREGNELECILEPTAMDIPDLINLLKEKNTPVIFVGDGVNKHKDFITENFKNPLFAPTYLNITRASSLGELGLQRIAAGDFDDPNSSPLYLKKPQAERELEKRMGMLHGLDL